MKIDQRSGDERRSTNPKDLLGMLKPPMHLVPPSATIWEAMAMKFGAYGIDAEGNQARPQGYGPFNWREHPVKASVYIDALSRHIARVVDGGCGVKADDSKVLDLAHARACLGILIDALESGNLIDDLSGKGPAGALLDKLTLKKKPTKEQHAEALSIAINVDSDEAVKRLNAITAAANAAGDGLARIEQLAGVIAIEELGRVHYVKDTGTGQAPARRRRNRKAAGRRSARQPR